MDDVGFFGASIPQEVRVMIPLLSKIDQSQFRKVVQKAVEHLKHVPFTDAQFEQYANATKLPKQTFATVFTGLLITLRAAVRTRVKIEPFQHLLTELRIPESFVADLVKALQTARGVLEESALEQRGSRGLPHIQELAWRVDVTISTTSMARAMKPSVTLRITLDDGRVRSFSVPADRFHELRFAVTKVLKDVDDLQKHPILKVE